MGNLTILKVNQGQFKKLHWIFNLALDSKGILGRYTFQI